MKFTTYIGHRPTGVHECSDWEVDTVARGRAYVEGHANTNQYILDGKFIDRPERPGDGYKWDWVALDWVADASIAESQATAKRKALLEESDWTQMPDVDIELKNAWAVYRQALRDITLQPNYPLQIIWPEKP